MDEKQVKQLIELETAALRNEVLSLRAFVTYLSATDRFTFQKPIQIFDGRNVQVGKGTGTKIGTETTQKLGFYGETPVVQAGAISDPSGGVTQDAECRTATIAIITALENIGIIAT